MIDNLRFTNFKSWRDTGEIRFGKITGIFGTNSSGKSSIIQFLLMLKETAESPDRAQVLDFGGEAERNYVNLGSLQDVLHKSSYPQPSELTWNIAWSLPKPLIIADPQRANRRLFAAVRLLLAVKVNNTFFGPIVDQFVYQFEDNGEQYSFGMRDDGIEEFDLISRGYAIKPIQSWNADLDSSSSNPHNVSDEETVPHLPAPVKCYAFPDQVNAYYQNAGFLSFLSASFQDLLGSLYYLGPLREYPKRQYVWGGNAPSDVGRRGEYVVNALLASRSMPPISRNPDGDSLTVENYVAYWLKYLGLVSDFGVHQVAPGRNSYEVRVRQFEEAPDVLISEVDFGVSQILPVIAICYYVPEGSTIILEQPEIHLHPSVQSGLADVFVDAIKRRNIQIIFESHSEHLLLRLQRRMAEEAVDPNRICLSFCERHQDESKSRPLKLDRFGNITNWPKDFFGDEFQERAEMMKAIARRMETESE